MTTSLTERLREARQAATSAKIALRHAKNDRADYHTYLLAGIPGGYGGLGKNPKARETKFAQMLADDKDAIVHERTLRTAEDDFDHADTDLACVLDEKHIANDKTWAILAECYRERTGRRMSRREQAGREVLKEQTETVLGDEIAEYKAQYGNVNEPPTPSPLPVDHEEHDYEPPDLDEYEPPF